MLLLINIVLITGSLNAKGQKLPYQNRPLNYVELDERTKKNLNNKCSFLYTIIKL